MQACCHPPSRKSHSVHLHPPAGRAEIAARRQQIKDPLLVFPRYIVNSALDNPGSLFHSEGNQLIVRATIQGGRSTDQQQPCSVIQPLHKGERRKRRSRRAPSLHWRKKKRIERSENGPFSHENSSRGVLLFQELCQFTRAIFMLCIKNTGAPSAPLR